MRETQSLHLHIICLRWRGEIRATVMRTRKRRRVRRRYRVSAREERNTLT